MKSVALTKFAAVSALALVAACSCVDAPDLDIADKGVNKRYDGSSTMPKADAMPTDKFAGQQNAQADRSILAAMPTEPVYFGFDSAALTSTAQSKLDMAAAYIKQNNVGQITVEGHCDERGTREYNLALGDRRAVAIKRYLTAKGVPADKIRTISYGKERPAVMAHNEQAWAKNRRGEIKF